MSASTPPRRGLGRGLGSLIPTAPPTGPAAEESISAPTPIAAPDGAATPNAPNAPDGSDGPGREQPQLAPVAGAHFAELPVSAITPNAVQPREVFDEEAMAELGRRWKLLDAAGKQPYEAQAARLKQVPSPAP